MSNVDEVIQVDGHDGPVLRILADVEGLLGLTIICFVGVIGLGVMGFVYLIWEWAYGAFHIPVPQRTALTLGWALLTFVECLSVRWIWIAWQNAPHPRPVWMALMQRDRGTVRNAALSVWWIIHMVAVIAVADWVVSEYQFFNPTVTQTAIAWTSKAGLLFGAAYASTGFLLLGIGRIWRNEGLIRKVWRARVPLDLLITGVLLWTGRE